MFPMRKMWAKKVIQVAKQTQKREFSSQIRNFKEVMIKVPWGYVNGKWWEPYDVKPILSIHGWQDNCGTFDRLIPLLSKDVGFLAIDMPGHGYSSRFPEGMLYTVDTHILLIRYLAETFKWPKVKFLGHSLGGVTGFSFGMLYPEEVDYVVCIDSCKPAVRDNNLDELKLFLGGFSKYDRLAFNSGFEPPCYSLDTINERLIKSTGNQIALEYVHHLVKRNVERSKLYPGKYYFTRDPRVKLQNYFRISQAEILRHCEKHVNFPVFFVKTTDGPYYENKKTFNEGLEILKKNEKFDYHFVNGNHYIHLNNPENLSGLINKFLQKYNTRETEIVMPEKEPVENDVSIIFN